MSSIAATVKVNTALAEFLVAIIEHTEEIVDSAPVRQETDYIEGNLGEIDAQNACSQDHLPNHLHKSKTKVVSLYYLGELQH